MEDLGVLPGGDYSQAIAINDRGEVVGRSTTPHGPRAFLWTRSSGMIDLNALVPSPKDFVLTAGVSINDRGVILAMGRTNHGGHGGHDHESPMRVFLLIPTP
jgi:probable HAF family extracellular repeat protein